MVVVDEKCASAISKATPAHLACVMQHAGNPKRGSSDCGRRGHGSRCSRPSQIPPYYMTLRVETAVLLSCSDALGEGLALRRRVARAWVDLDVLDFSDPLLCAECRVSPAQLAGDDPTLMRQLADATRLRGNVGGMVAPLPSYLGPLECQGAFLAIFPDWVAPPFVVVIESYVEEFSLSPSPELVAA